MLETASIASGATLALFVVLIICMTIYVRWHRNQKQKRITIEENGNGVDTVDGFHGHHGMRPFGPHHYHTIPLADAVKR